MTNANNNKADKEVVARLPARVLIGRFIDFEISLSNDFVRFAFQSTGGGVEVGPKIFVFDHRKETIDFVKEKGNNLDFRQKEEFLKVLNVTANVVVVKKTSDKGEIEFINLFNISLKEKIVGLLSVTMYTEKHNAGFNIEEDNALFSFESRSSSRTGRHVEMLFLALTDDDHCVAIYKNGYANVGHDEPKIVRMGKECEEFSEEEYTLCA